MYQGMGETRKCASGSVGDRCRWAPARPVGPSEESERHRKKPKTGSSGHGDVEPGRADCDARLARQAKEKRVAQQEALKEALITTEHEARTARTLAKMEEKDAAKKARAEEAAWQASLRAEEVLNRAEELKHKEAGSAEKAAEKAVTPAACAMVVPPQCPPSAGQQPITLWCSRSGRGPMLCESDRDPHSSPSRSRALL